jgi:hypothetical protein
MHVRTCMSGHDVSTVLALVLSQLYFKDDHQCSAVSCLNFCVTFKRKLLPFRSKSLRCLPPEPFFCLAERPIMALLYRGARAPLVRSPPLANAGRDSGRGGSCVPSPSSSSTLDPELCSTNRCSARNSVSGRTSRLQGPDSHKSSRRARQPRLKG